MQWFLKYIEYYGLFKLFQDKTVNKTLEKIINDSGGNLPKTEIFLNAKMQKEFSDIINYYSSNIKSSNFQTSIPISPTPTYINDIFYYSNFILISEYTTKAIFNNYFSELLYFNCYFGDSKIFVSFNEPHKYLIDLYNLDNNKNILPEIFFKFNREKDLSNNIFLLKEKGYYQFIKHHLMFYEDNNNNEDLTSPIFDLNNKEIGYAYKYDQNIKDYSPYVTQPVAEVCGFPFLWLRALSLY